MEQYNRGPSTRTEDNSNTDYDQSQHTTFKPAPGLNAQTFRQGDLPISPTPESQIRVQDTPEYAMAQLSRTQMSHDVNSNGNFAEAGVARHHTQPIHGGYGVYSSTAHLHPSTDGNSAKQTSLSSSRIQGVDRSQPMAAQGVSGPYSRTEYPLAMHFPHYTSAYQDQFPLPMGRENPWSPENLRNNLSRDFVVQRHVQVQGLFHGLESSVDGSCNGENGFHVHGGYLDGRDPIFVNKDMPNGSDDASSDAIHSSDRYIRASNATSLASESVGADERSLGESQSTITPSIKLLAERGNEDAIQVGSLDLTATSSAIGDPDPLRCGKGNCRARFRGEYRRGNRSRHLRERHGGSDGSGKSYDCEEPSCGKSFNRTDARLKHYRKQHPLLATIPQSRKSTGSNLSPAQATQGYLLGHVATWSNMTAGEGM